MRRNESHSPGGPAVPRGVVLAGGFLSTFAPEASLSADAPMTFPCELGSCITQVSACGVRASVL